MALHIERDDPATREQRAMATTGGNTAEERLYETIDGKLVREGDPRGAFLKYAPGDKIADRHAEAYKELTDNSGSKAAQAYTDDDVRNELRLRQAAPEPATVVPQRPQMSDRLATELADEARAQASLPAEERAKIMEQSVPDSNATFTPHAVWRKEDGSLTHEGDTEGVTQAYAPGDRVQDQDVDAFRSMGAPPNADNDATDQDNASGDVATKAAAPAPNKARTVTRDSSTK